MTIEQAKKRIIVALDVPNALEARTLTRQIKEHIGLVKVGLQLFTNLTKISGSDVVRVLQKEGAGIFLDLKFHDIPNTVAEAARNIAWMNVFMFNVHCLGGMAMMQAARKAVAGVETERVVPSSFILGVTILTSLDQPALQKLGITGTPEESVVRLAAMAQESGLHGVVASPKEIEAIRRECGDKFLIVTPGVRPKWASKDDQARVLTPGEAVQAGANWVVIGRPIRNYPSEKGGPAAAAKLIAEEIAQAMN